LDGSSYPAGSNRKVNIKKIQNLPVEGGEVVNLVDVVAD